MVLRAERMRRWQFLRGVEAEAQGTRASSKLPEVKEAYEVDWGSIGNVPLAVEVERRFVYPVYAASIAGATCFSSSAS